MQKLTHLITKLTVWSLLRAVQSTLPQPMQESTGILPQAAE